MGGLAFEDAQAFWSLVERCEDGGVDSLWQSDRLVSQVPYPEALASMAAIAGATERIKFGMNAVVVGLRDPLVLARQCASIDFLSGGRLLPVFGVGRAKGPEWAATGRDPAGRGRRADEALELISRLWSEEHVRFEGEHFQYRDACIAPRPVQQPMPLWIGGSSPAAIRRTARVGTGWIGGIQTPSQVAPVIAAIREQALAAGREILADHYGATVPFRLGEASDPLVERFSHLASRSGSQPGVVVAGDVTALIARIAAYRDAGASKFVLIPLARPGQDLMGQVDRVVAEVIPEVQAPAFAEAS